MDKEKFSGMFSHAVRKDLSLEFEKNRLFAERPDSGKPGFQFSKVLCVFSDLVLVYCLFIATISIKEYFGSFGNESMACPDLGFLGYLLPAAFVFAGLTHTFYYNKERFANCLKLRFEFIKQLLMFKLNSGLYSKDSLEMQLDSVIEQAESEADSLSVDDSRDAESRQDNISV